MKKHFPALLLAALTVLLAALLIFQCVDIYRAGTSPENLTSAGVKINDIYSREDVALRLGRLAWAFGLWAAALAAAIICRRVCPPDAPKPRISAEAQLYLLKARREMTPAMAREERMRRRAAWICGGICLLCAAAGGAYLLNPRSFASTDLEAVMAAMVAHTLPPLLIAFAAPAVLAQIRHTSASREIALARDAAPRAADAAPPAAPGLRQRLLPALYLAALGLIVAGVLNGGMYDVLVKAVNICTECIGLG